MKRFCLFIAFASLLCAAPAQQAPDASKMKPAVAPSVEHHEFNPNMPEKLGGEMVDLAAEDPDDGPIHAYVAGNPASKRQIIIIHEWWGLNDHIKGTADQFADMGYRVYAPNLYGKPAAEPGNRDQARALMSEAMENPERLGEILGLAIEAARRDNPNAKLATMGWCFGGGWSLQAALRHPSAVSACVVYYGQLVTDSDELRGLNGTPVQGIIASRDGWITPELAEEFKAAMTEAGQSVEIHVYEADHAFANPSGDRFDDKAAREAWSETMRFLDQHLAGGKAPKAAHPKTSPHPPSKKERPKQKKKSEGPSA